jgi:putative CocE/NonD family hydrolase
MLRRGRLSIWLLVVVPSVLLFVDAVSAFAEEYSVLVETAWVKMRDGVLLAADIYHPKAPGKYPVLLQRTPYNRRDAATGNALASQGYVVVLQDTRGRFDSEGDFYPFRYESQDGYDTVEWAASLAYSDGQVGMFGGSYVGATQMLAAIAGPPHLVAIFPFVTASEYYDSWTYQSGALMQWFASSWSAGLVQDTARRRIAGLSQPKEWIWQLPVETFRLLALPEAPVAPYYRDWVAHERDDRYWKPWKVSDHYGKTKVKALHAGGWHDIFLKGSIKNYVEMRKQAATESARSTQRLMIGPWAHAATSREGKIGDVIFGKEAYLDMNQTILKWSAFALKGQQNEWAAGAPVRIFVMGENKWREEQEFPLARTRYTKYFLDSEKGANTGSGDGRLALEMPKGRKSDNYEYDPNDPVPTIGGRLCCGDAIAPGPFDQRPNETRPDVLIFSTSRLEKDLEVTGYITAEIFAQSSAVDTDFTALLADVEPSGYARILTDGIVRARYRNSTENAELLEPGKIYKFTIDLWATSNLFKAGHKLRLYISSSNFPRFNRNPNTGEATQGAVRLTKARQTIYHDTEHPSVLTLPVIPR